MATSERDMTRVHGVSLKYDAPRSSVYMDDRIVVLDLPQSLRLSILTLVLDDPEAFDSNIYIYKSESSFLPKHTIFQVSYNIRLEAWELYVRRSTWNCSHLPLDLNRNPYQAISSLQRHLRQSPPPSSPKIIQITVSNIEKATLTSLTLLVEILTSREYVADASYFKGSVSYGEKVGHHPQLRLVCADYEWEGQVEEFGRGLQEVADDILRTARKDQITGAQRRISVLVFVQRDAGEGRGHSSEVAELINAYWTVLTGVERPSVAQLQESERAMKAR
jgi:hypothetical protein